MGHRVHGVVGSMDPHAMAGSENFVTWVHFASRPARGMLQERSWGCEDGQGEGGARVN